MTRTIGWGSRAVTFTSVPHSPPRWTAARDGRTVNVDCLPKVRRSGLAPTWWVSVAGVGRVGGREVGSLDEGLSLARLVLLGEEAV